MSEYPAKRISVLIVDDHTIVRQGLITLLELYDDLEVVGEAENGSVALDKIALLRPEVVLMDLVMPVLDGIAATSQISERYPATRVIALTSFIEDEKVVHAVQAGAFGYLLKDVTPNDLVDAIRAASRGEARLHPDAARKLMKQVAAQPTSPAIQPHDLTQREIEVLGCIARGLSNRDIAAELVLSEKTVKTHVSSLLSKLNLDARTQLAIYAIKNGLVPET